MVGEGRCFGVGWLIGRCFLFSGSLVRPVGLAPVPLPVVWLVVGTRSAGAQSGAGSSCFGRPVFSSSSFRRPADGVLTAYADFFTRFKGFGEFVDFFYLQDLVHPTTTVAGSFCRSTTSSVPRRRLQPRSTWRTARSHWSSSRDGTAGWRSGPRSATRRLRFESGAAILAACP